MKYEKNVIGRLKDYCAEAEVHTKRLTIAVKHLSKVAPFTVKSLETISDENLAYLDLLATRFSKLQDVIGAKMFPSLIIILKEEDKSFIDKLNKLERLEYIPSTEWWDDLRELRNDFIHDYPTDHEKVQEMPVKITKLMNKSQELISFWADFKTKIQKYIK